MKLADLPKRERDKIARMDAAFDKIDALLHRLGQQGLQRMTRSSATELKALSQTAHNAALIRVERELEALATHVERYLDRDPLFTAETYLTSVNRIWLLNRRARQKRAQGVFPKQMLDLIGEARRKYEELDEPLVIQPIGASGWLTDTDFVGITVYFYVDGDPVIYKANNTKPARYFGTDPRRLLHSSISDYVTTSIWDMAHGAFSLTHAKVSRDGRLSLHKNLEVDKAPWFGGRAYQALAARDWIALVDRLRQNQSDPVQGQESELVYVEPHGLGGITVDQKTQTATAPVYDDSGAAITMEVRLRPENNFLVDNLEYLCSKRGEGIRPNGLFGRVRVADGQLKLFPMSAIYHDPVELKLRGTHRVHEIHLSLESLKQVKR